MIASDDLYICTSVNPISFENSYAYRCKTTRAIMLQIWALSNGYPTVPNTAHLLGVSPLPSSKFIPDVAKMIVTNTRSTSAFVGFDEATGRKVRILSTKEMSSKMQKTIIPSGTSCTERCRPHRPELEITSLIHIIAYTFPRYAKTGLPQLAIANTNQTLLEYFVPKSLR